MRRPDDFFNGAKFNTKSFGVVEIVDYRGTHDVDVVFLETGTKCTFEAGNIRKGTIKNPEKPNVFKVGYMGLGIYKAKVKGKNTKAYDRWSHMLRRCYCDIYQSKYPTYIGCSVCDEWHNFQNFAKWFHNNYPDDGVAYDLDKDIKIPGNKLYSPETCMFATKKENYSTAHAKEFAFISPDGEILRFNNLRDFCKGDEPLRKALNAVHSGARKSHKGWKKADWEMESAEQ